MLQWQLMFGRLCGHAVRVVGAAMRHILVCRLGGHPCSSLAGCEHVQCARCPHQGSCSVVYVSHMCEVCMALGQKASWGLHVGGSVAAAS